MTDRPLSPQSRPQYEFQSLTEEHLPCVVELQDIVVGALRQKACERFIIEKTEGEFAQFMQPPHIAMGAFVTDGQDKVLAGMAFVGFLPGPGATDQPSGLVQSVLVNPAFRGQGLMGKLLSEVETTATRKDEPVVLNSRVAIGNDTSASNFVEAGYQRVGRERRRLEIDPDGTMVELFAKRLPPANAALVSLALPANEIEPVVKQSAALSRIYAQRRL